MNVEFPTLQIARALSGEVASQDVIDQAMRLLLTHTDARAVGLWRLEGERLRLLGFAAVSEMADEVQEDFVVATRLVSLSQTRLGIVSAILTRGPAVAHVQPGVNGLVDSASWLAKFQAVQSLSVPVVKEGAILGVLAVSTANPFAEGDDVWNRITELADGLGQ